MLLLLAVAFAGCKKDDDDDKDPVDTFQPKQEQWGFAVNYTAKWCGPCGSWGAPLIKSLADVNRSVAITNHASNDPMYNQDLYQSMAADRPTGGGIPSFWVADEKVTTSNAVSKMNETVGKPATTGIILKYSVSGGKMEVETRTKFFSAGTGEYYLSVYVLESGIPGGSANSSPPYTQSGASDPNYTHDYVLRASNTGQAYGELLVSNPAADETVDKKYSITVDPTWVNDLYAAAILWKYDATASPKYIFVNAYQVK